jgi:hypothetical protein
MISYDEFLNWAAEDTRQRWEQDLVSWQGLLGDIPRTASAVYGLPRFTVHLDIWGRVEATYGKLW